MADLTLFPVPISLEAGELEELGATYVATELTLGTDVLEDVLTHTAGAEGAKSCIQQVLRLLLTEKASIPSTPQTGCNLLALGRAYNPNTINEDVVMILLDVELQCKANDTQGNVPLAAQLGEIELLALDLSGTGQLKLTIGVKTVSGNVGTLNVAV